MSGENTVIVEKILGIPISNQFGEFHMGAYITERRNRIVEHILLYQNLDSSPCNLRVNSACWTGDIFGDSRCDCNWQLEYAMRYISEKKQGLVIYHMHHEGRANGIIAKLQSYVQSESHGQKGAAAYTSIGHKADAREFGSSVVILKDLGITKVNLLTNNPEKAEILQRQGISVESILGVRSPDPSLTDFYDWKREHFNHSV